MCYFLTVTFDEKFRETVKSVFARAGLRLRRNGNAFFERDFGAGAASYDVTDGHCSCALYADLDAGEEAVNPKKLIKKFRKKGLSEKRIEEAVERETAAAAERQKSREERSAGLRKTFADLFAQIGDYRLFVHLYKGSIDEEKLGGADHLELKITELLNGNAEIAEDVIIKIKK